MITVGYGDITPQNSIEKMFVVFAMLITGIVWIYSINEVNIIPFIKKSSI